MNAEDGIKMVEKSYHLRNSDGAVAEGKEKNARYWGSFFSHLPFVMYGRKGGNRGRRGRVAAPKRPWSNEQLAHPIKDAF